MLIFICLTVAGRSVGPADFVDLAGPPDLASLVDLAGPPGLASLVDLADLARPVYSGDPADPVYLSHAS